MHSGTFLADFWQIFGRFFRSCGSPTPPGQFFRTIAPLRGVVGPTSACTNAKWDISLYQETIAPPRGVDKGGANFSLH